MASSNPVTTPSSGQSLTPPRPTFTTFTTDSGSDGELEPSSTHAHSRTHSHTSAATSSVDSPPVTPRSYTFTTPQNPFSPPASVRSFSSPEHTPAVSPGVPGIHGHIHYPFPESTSRSGVNSLATSSADLPRVSSSYSVSRPTTAEYPLAGSNLRLREAFSSPPARPLTFHAASAPIQKTKKERPKSTMLSETNPISKLWLQSRDPHARLAYILTYSMMFLGVIAGALRCYFDWNSVRLMKGNLCPVLIEEFDNGEEGIFGDNGIFFREVDMSGFGNNEFDMATASSNNSFVRNGHLYIMPTLTSDNIGVDAVFDGRVYNISGCTYNITRGWSYTTSTITSPANVSSAAIGTDVAFDAEAYYKACSAVSNSTAGKIIPPIQSARLSTRKTASIRYGKVEVRAKIPTGDWMWPAIWMLPVDSVYGPWPMSGEIDIMEARGNGKGYPFQGTHFVRGSLNWGPMLWLNGVLKTYGVWTSRFQTYDKAFHTYTLEWTEDFIRLYVDSRLHHMLDLRIDVPFFDRGEFPPIVQNGSETIVLQNPWINGTRAAPFDQRFYLILNVAIGGTNGWFPDNVGKKPWLDGSLTAMREFAKAQDQWYPSWPQDPEERAMVIDSVKMWQQC